MHQAISVGVSVRHPVRVRRSSWNRGILWLLGATGLLACVETEPLIGPEAVNSRMFDAACPDTLAALLASCRPPVGDTLAALANAFSDTTHFRASHPKCDSLRGVFADMLPGRVYVANHDELEIYRPPPLGQSIAGMYIGIDGGYILFSAFLFTTIHDPYDTYGPQRINSAVHEAAHAAGYLDEPPDNLPSAYKAGDFCSRMSDVDPWLPKLTPTFTYGYNDMAGIGAPTQFIASLDTVMAGPITYVWDFDGVQQQGDTVAYTFETNKDYVVTLTASADSMQGSVTDTIRPIRLVETDSSIALGYWEELVRDDGQPLFVWGSGCWYRSSYVAPTHYEPRAAEAGHEGAYPFFLAPSLTTLLDDQGPGQGGGFYAHEASITVDWDDGTDDNEVLDYGTTWVGFEHEYASPATYELTISVTVSKSVYDNAWNLISTTPLGLGSELTTQVSVLPLTHLPPSSGPFCPMFAGSTLSQ